MADEPELGRREAHKVATRAALEAAALRLFRDRGYDATSVADIAAEAGVAGRTFFRYFASKEDVLLADLVDVPPLLHAALAARPPGEQPLVAIREALFSVGRTPRYGVALLGREVFAEPAVSARLLQLSARWETALADAIADRLRFRAAAGDPPADVESAGDPPADVGPAGDPPADVELYAAVTARAALGALRAATRRHYVLQRDAGPERDAGPDSVPTLRELITSAFAVLENGCSTTRRIPSDP